MERDTIKCSCCEGSGKVYHCLFWEKPCGWCKGTGILKSPLYGLSLKRNPDPADLQRLGIQITTIRFR